MAIPDETAKPGNRRSAMPRSAGAAAWSSILIELAFDQFGEGGYRSFGLSSGGYEPNHCARCSRQHHQAHNRASGHLGAVLANPDLGVEQRGRLDKARGRTSMQSA